VYRFLDETGRIAYIGMSKNLSSRVRQHFNNASNPTRAQELRRKVHKITWEETGSELMALILEDVLIRRHHPPLNAAQKVVGKGWSVEHFTCRAGTARLSLVKGRKPTAVRHFRSKSEGEAWLREVVESFGLNPGWSGLPGMAWSGSWVDNAASRALHNARYATWRAALSDARAKQAESTSVHFPATPTGQMPEILMELGRFRAFRFTTKGGSDEWQYDAGSGRIDAALERYFLEDEVA
jgi:predicted GIY-YIG superfamily endonuclease